MKKEIKEKIRKILLKIYKNSQGKFEDGSWFEETADQISELSEAEIQKAHQDGYAKGRIKCLEQHCGKELDKALTEKIKEIEGLKKRCMLCGEIKKERHHLDFPDHGIGEIKYNEAIDQVLSILKEKR